MLGLVCKSGPRIQHASGGDGKAAPHLRVGNVRSAGLACRRGESDKRKQQELNIQTLARPRVAFTGKRSGVANIALHTNLASSVA